MNPRTIDGVVIQALKQFPDERGTVLHMMRNDNPFFDNFGEIYFSEIFSGVIKAWKWHSKMTQFFAVPVGCIQLILFDDRVGSPTNGNVMELTTGRENYLLIKIPPQVWYGFKGISDGPALLANCADFPHTPGESQKKPLNDPDIPFVW